MKEFKTLKLFDHFQSLLEQSPELQDQVGQEEPVDDVQDVTDPNAGGAGEEMPLTSEAEEQYIEDLIDAALFQPSSEEAKTLLNLQNVIKSKSFTNAREEVLPLVLSLIQSETSTNDLKDSLDQVR